MLCSGSALPLWLLLTSETYTVCHLTLIKSVASMLGLFSSNFTAACDCAVVIHMATWVFSAFFWWQKMFFLCILLSCYPVCPSLLSVILLIAVFFSVTFRIIIFYLSACFHHSRISVFCSLLLLLLLLSYSYPMCSPCLTITGLLVVTQHMCQHSEWSSADSHGALKRADTHTHTHAHPSTFR